MTKRPKAARRSSAEWASLIEACSRSGLSYAAFAEREGIHPGTFTWWASKLGGAARRGSLNPEATSSTDTATFVPVRIRADNPTHVRASPVRNTASGAVEIVLANGRRVSCDLAQVDDPRLAALLRLAEGSSVC